MSTSISEAITESENTFASLQAQKTGLEQRLVSIDERLQAPPSDDVEAEIVRYRDLTSEREGVARAIAGTETKIAAASARLASQRTDERNAERAQLTQKLREDVVPITEAIGALVEAALPLEPLCRRISELDPRLVEMPQNEPLYRTEAGERIVRALKVAQEKIENVLKVYMPTR